MNDLTSSTQVREDYFGDETRWQSWLDVEAAMALTQSEIGMIPEQAGPEIAKVAKLSCLDLQQLRREIGQTMAPVFALSECLARAAGPAGAYVHWGATTQNIIETGRLLVLRRVQSRLVADLADVLNHLADEADSHAELVMVGRTNRQNALPITFGFKVAGWIDELIRVSDQLHEIEPRLFQLRFGGAIGGYHSFGEQGPELAQRLADRLGLVPSMVPNRTSVDPLIEYTSKLSLLGTAISRLSGELYLLTAEEIREIDEIQSNGVVGSSTMPQKVNPKHVVKLNMMALQLRSQAATAFAVPSPSHEGDTVTNQHLTALITDTCELAMDTLEKAKSTLRLVRPNRQRMQQNVDATRAMMATEALMMRLAGKLGRSRAHDLVHAVTFNASERGVPLQLVVNENAEICGVLGSEEIDNILNSNDNIGHCAKIARQAATAARAAASGPRA